MGIAFLKKMNVLMPDSIKRIAAPIIRSKLINNAVYQNQFNDLINMDSMNELSIEKEQFERLKSTLIHAYEHTQYYKAIFDRVGFNPYLMMNFKELEKIPVLTKNDIKNNINDILADDINDFYTATTGGSSGSPLTVYLDKNSIYKERAFIYHFWSKYGYDYKNSKVASFRGTDFNGKISKANPLYNEIQLNPCLISADTISVYYKKMNSFGVEFLHGFPSAIYSFCKFAKEANLDVYGKYKCVFFISENVYGFQKKTIEEVLGCKTAPFYGHTERAVFGEMYDGLYHFNPFYGYTELSDISSGQIICTGFINPKMPLIRYMVDDTGEKIAEGFHITGHRDGILYGEDNIQISAASLEVHSEVLNKIANYQFEQSEVGNFKVKVVPLQKLTEREISDLNLLFQKRVGDAFKVQIEVVDKMIVTTRGKYQLLIQNISKEERE